MFLKLNLLLLWFQSSSLDADEWQLLQGSVPRGSVPQEKLVFSSPGWPRGSNLHWIAPYLQQKQAAPSTRRPAGPSSHSTRELRCQCLSITPTIYPRMISNLEMIPAGPQCPKVELIATLKNGKEACLDPEAPLIKKIIQKILSSGKQNN
ncbi:alveolar macrophage chemotactic factor isoform X1 [Desmodus rotundus]|uniref:alveolar macrophage chemotactic factor isoform X1 n=1 Tax=Desmodus rotundus TaxID=9430 RepID=UPI0023813B20|nr:C-X-C motif chemokine 6 isoform X1 [Desmodus rotundus]